MASLSSLRILSLVGLCLVTSATTSFSQEDPGGWDVSLFRSINNSRSSFRDDIVKVNNGAVLPFGIAAPVGLFVYGEAKEQEYEIDSGILVGVTEIVSLSIGYGLKRMVRRDRPFARLVDVHYSRDETNDSFSFPSGHAVGAFAIATSLSLRYPEPYVYLPMHFWALLVAYGRVYSGVHYPSDVLAGAAIGSGTALVVHLLEPEILRLRRKIFGGEDDRKGGRGTAVFNFLPLPGGGLLRFSYHL